jgi:arsenite methyltransferase
MCDANGAGETDVVNLENSRDYYGRVLTGSDDLITDACCTTEAPPPSVREALARVHPDVRARYYGCGLVIPDAIDGCRVLDLGSGSGQDAFVLAQLVGEAGSVVGVDATGKQLAVARGALEWQREAFGYARSNVEFLEGDIEELDRLALPDASFDVIVSNCVINLVADKARVFRQAHKLLKPGGEMYFSDVYSDRRVPQFLRDDPILHGECLGGALYWGDFLPLAKAAGFGDPRLVRDRRLSIRDSVVRAQLGAINFFSATYRLFKLDGLEPECEDYGQAVVYRGTVAGLETAFELDKHHRIETGRVFPVCGNSWRMLAESRFAEHFHFIGDFSRHFGVFAGCGTGLPFATPQADLGGASAAACC